MARFERAVLAAVGWKKSMSIGEISMGSKVRQNRIVGAEDKPGPELYEVVHVEPGSVRATGSAGADWWLTDGEVYWLQVPTSASGESQVAQLLSQVESEFAELVAEVEPGLEIEQVSPFRSKVQRIRHLLIASKDLLG